MNRLFYFSVLLLLLLSACKNETETVDLEFVFLPTYDGQPLVMLDETYEYEDNMKLRMQLFQFFVSKVELLRNEGDGLELIDIDLISFGDLQDQQSAISGIARVIKEIPAGTYEGLKFGIGVEESVNSSQPGDYAAGHPLSGHYWSAASSYVFFKVEGNADIDQSDAFAQKLTFHVGTNPNYQEKVFNQEIKIGASNSLRLEVEVDLKKLLIAENGDYLDFKTITQAHSGEAPPAKFLAANIASAFSLK